jgi:tetratricopeptide (TPR) repeat protein
MHLRLGALALARVELETLVGLGSLDTIGSIDLAEARWRTGDLTGAGEMANQALLAAEDDPVALVIASEAASALGRPSEARRLASLAIERAPDAIDMIFAGMPRSGVWPTDAAEPAPTAPTLFDRGPENTLPPAAAGPDTDEAAAGGGPPAPAVASLTLGLWGGDEVAEQESADMPDPAREFEAGRAALVSGAFDEAAFRLGLALRLAPALAPAVLEVTEGSRSAGLTVIRGDAYRLAGYEAEARREYAVAAHGGLPERRKRVRSRSKASPPNGLDAAVAKVPTPKAKGRPDGAGPPADAVGPTPTTDDPGPDDTGAEGEPATDETPSS